MHFNSKIDVEKMILHIDWMYSSQYFLFCFLSSSSILYISGEYNMVGGGDGLIRTISAIFTLTYPVYYDAEK